jgi:NAD(P)-dependent dehydrogenase (short-subunit alcohol dehydrogenase family)
MEQKMPIETDAITPKKIAIVTGGSRGIGRSTVESLARRGVNTIFTYHTHGTDAEAVVAAVKDAGAEAVALQLDAGNIASFDAFVESVKMRSLTLEPRALTFWSTTPVTVTATCRLQRRPRKSSTASTTSISKAFSS